MRDDAAPDVSKEKEFVVWVYQRLSSGELRYNELISTAELSKLSGVGEVTVKRGVAALRAAGVAKGVRGRGIRFLQREPSPVRVEGKRVLLISAGLPRARVEEIEVGLREAASGSGVLLHITTMQDMAPSDLAISLQGRVYDGALLRLPDDVSLRAGYEAVVAGFRCPVLELDGVAKRQSAPAWQQVVPDRRKAAAEVANHICSQLLTPEASSDQSDATDSKHCASVTPVLYVLAARRVSDGGSSRLAEWVTGVLATLMDGGGDDRPKIEVRVRFAEEVLQSQTQLIGGVEGESQKQGELSSAPTIFLPDSVFEHEIADDVAGRLLTIRCLFELGCLSDEPSSYAPSPRPFWDAGRKHPAKVGWLATSSGLATGVLDALALAGQDVGSYHLVACCNDEHRSYGTFLTRGQIDYQQIGAEALRLLLRLPAGGNQKPVMTRVLRRRSTDVWLHKAWLALPGSAVIRKAQTGAVVAFNPVFQAIVNKGTAELLGKTPPEFWGKGFGNEILERDRLVLERGPMVTLERYPFHWQDQVRMTFRFPISVHDEKPDHVASLSFEMNWHDDTHPVVYRYLCRPQIEGGFSLEVDDELLEAYFEQSVLSVSVRNLSSEQFVLFANRVYRDVMAIDHKIPRFCPDDRIRKYYSDRACRHPAVEDLLSMTLVVRPHDTHYPSRVQPVPPRCVHFLRLLNGLMMPVAELSLGYPAEIRKRLMANQSETKQQGIIGEIALVHDEGTPGFYRGE